MNFSTFVAVMRDISKQELLIQLRRGGTKHYVAESGRVLNIADCEAHRLCDPAVYRYKYKTAPRNMLLAPIFDRHTGKTIGIIEMINKSEDVGESSNPAGAGGTGQPDGPHALHSAAVQTYIYSIKGSVTLGAHFF